MPTAAPHRRAWAAAAIALVVTTAACGDPPPDPSTAPIEVVANSLAKPNDACILNRPSVGAGTHELVVIAESSKAHVRMQDATGRAVVELQVEPGATKTTTVVLEAGRYTVSCADVGGSPVTSVALRVAPE